MRPAIPTTLAILATALAAYVAPVSAAPEITICHMPQDGAGTVQTMRVSIHDWPDHKSHGDMPGFCRVVFDGALPAGDEDGSPDVAAPAAGGDDPAATGEGEFKAVLCDGRSGDHGRLIEVSETGRIAVRSAECG